MKNLTQKTSLVAGVILFSIVLTGCFRKQVVDTPTYNPTVKEVEKFDEHAKEEHGEGEVYVNAEELAAYALGELSTQEEADIIHMRQEEKMARDVYRTLGETYSINQFKNIPMSEQKHTDAMELLLERYAIEDPIVDETIVGTYKDEKFVTLFNELTTLGEKSLIDALTAGAMIEDINMAKLLEVLENTDNEDIQFVYESVLGQSHHHMNAFIRGLEKEGANYTPTHISQEYFDSILEEDEKGAKKGGGEGKGKNKKEDNAYVPTATEKAGEIIAAPTVEEFYTIIEELWLAASPEANDLTPEQRAEHLQKVLFSHESHLPGLTTQVIQDKVYGIVTQLVIDAMLTTND